MGQERVFSTIGENGRGPAALAGPASNLDWREGIMIWMLKDDVVTVPRHKGGANAVEYALIMALVRRLHHRRCHRDEHTDRHPVQ